MLRAVGLELESELPFAGLHQLLGPLLPSVAELPSRQREVLESALAIGPSVTHDGLAVAAGVLGVLAGAAQRSPLLVVIDDAQWIDSGSFDAVLFAFRRLRDERIALVVGSRLEGTVPVVRPGDFLEIGLHPLDMHSARLLVSEHTPSPLDHATVDRLVALGGGVPLALIELARSGGSIDPGSFGTADSPNSITPLVDRLFGQRIRELTSSVATATLLAALDEPTEQDAFLRAGQILGVTPSDWEEAERASVLRIADGRVDFHHPLLREAVLSAASPEARRRAHLAIAEAMEARGDADRAVTHRGAGTIGADEALAAKLEQAAERHRDRAGHIAAARALVQSSRLSPTATESARRLLLAADDARRGGEPGWAESLAVEVRRASPDPLLRARAELIQAHIEARRGSTDAALGRYQRVADQVSRVAPDLAALALTYASSAAAVVGDMSGALRVALRADAMPRDQLSEETVIAMRETLGVALALTGDARRAHPLLSEVATWYERQPDRVGAEYVAEALTWLGDFARVRRLLDDLAADARGLGAPGLLIQTLALRADLGYRTGDWSAAIGDASEAVSLAEDCGQPVLLAYSLAVLAILEAGTGADGARATAERALEGGREHGLHVVEESACFALAVVELAAGNPEAALVELEPVAAAAADGGRGEPAMSLWPAELIEALIVVDRRAEADVVLDRLEAQGARTGGAWAQGVAARYRGVLADEETLDAVFTTAIEHHRNVGMPFELARTRLCYGQRLRRSGRRIAARAEIREALSTFRSLNASTWVARAERELAGSGERLRHAAVSDRDALTSQELQIARLIAAGVTNREAAADLFLSPKTIETHLTRIYRKLGIRSRSQLASRMSSDSTQLLTSHDLTTTGPTP